jgi:t-SNARE complex subunit (syntaxin)
MATLADIIEMRDAAVHILDQEIVDALRKQNSAATEDDKARFDKPVQDLMSQRTRVFVQAANDAMKSGEVAAALQQLKDIVSDMNKVAAKMGSVTGFFNNVHDLIDASGKIVDVIKGGK